MAAFGKGRARRDGARVSHPQRLRNEQDDSSYIPALIGNAGVLRLGQPRAGKRRRGGDGGEGTLSCRLVSPKADEVGSETQAEAQHHVKERARGGRDGKLDNESYYG